MCSTWVFQDSLICASEDDPAHIQIWTRCHGEDFTYSLKAQAPEDTHRWSSVLWEHIYHMSKAWQLNLLCAWTFRCVGVTDFQERAGGFETSLTASSFSVLASHTSTQIQGRPIWAHSSEVQQLVQRRVGLGDVSIRIKTQWCFVRWSVRLTSVIFGPLTAADQWFCLGLTESVQTARVHQTVI